MEPVRMGVAASWRTSCHGNAENTCFESPEAARVLPDACRHGIPGAAGRPSHACGDTLDRVRFVTVVDS
jgi:hypothetical protein